MWVHLLPYLYCVYFKVLFPDLYVLKDLNKSFYIWNCIIFRYIFQSYGFQYFLFYKETEPYEYLQSGLTGFLVRSYISLLQFAYLHFHEIFNFFSIYVHNLHGLTYSHFVKFSLENNSSNFQKRTIYNIHFVSNICHRSL